MCYSEVADYLAQQTKEKSKHHDPETAEDEPPRLINPFGKDEIGENKADESLRSKQAKEAAAAIGHSAGKYVTDSAKAWKLTDERGLKAPVKLMFESLKAVKTASAGDVPASAAIEKTSSYVNGERQFLSTLSSQTASDWLEGSGLNNLDRSTIGKCTSVLGRVVESAGKGRSAY
jgi:hypothetical protein